MDTNYIFEFDDKELDKIKNEQLCMGRQKVICQYLEYLSFSIKITDTEPDADFHKFEWKTRDKLKLHMKSEDFEALSKTFMMNDFSNYLLKTNKIAISILKFNDDLYLETAVI